METYFQAETITAYALGQRRGFALGLVCGAALVIYVNRYSLVRRNRPAPTLRPGQTDYAGRQF